ncbi:hypothetical protein [Ekhidna sp.]|uniref:hypothetical protein n=1 Tax=Ekhidna sp. TaxID=2608089 RepID=UPI003CCBB73E
MKYKLDDIDKKEVYKVPNGYFEDLPLKIQTRINKEKNAAIKRSIPSWSLALAASIILIITFIFILPTNNTSSAEEILASVPQGELLAYLDQIELDEYEIASTINDGDEIFEFEDPNVLEGIDINDESLDDVLLEYDLQDEYL